MGVILFEMTCGRLPFEGSRPVEIALKHVQEPPPSPELFREDIPAGLSELILKCLKKKLNERFHDMQEFLDECDQVFPQHDTPHQTPSIARKTGANRHVAASIAETAKSFGRGLSPHKLIIVAFSILFPLIVILLMLLMFTHKPMNTLHEIEWMEAVGNHETQAIEPEVTGGYPLTNLNDGDLTTAWLNTMPLKPLNPVLVTYFSKKTLILNIGIAVGYQKSVDDAFGDRFRIFKKPRILTVETNDGFKQRLRLDNIKGMQYPNIKAVETTELRFYLDDVYETDNNDYAISEIRLLGMEVK
jgi:serine/threonine protein kinase